MIYSQWKVYIISFALLYLRFQPLQQTRKTSRQEPSEERVIESTEETVVGDEGIPLDDSLGESFSV